MPSFTVTLTAIDAPARKLTIATSIDAVVHVLPNMPLDDVVLCRAIARQYLIDYYRGLQTRPPVPTVDPALTAALNQPITVTF